MNIHVVVQRVMYFRCWLVLRSPSRPMISSLCGLRRP